MKLAILAYTRCVIDRNYRIKNVMNTAAPLEKLSFEDALKELTDIVGKMESGNVPLEDSVKLYERGDSLRKHCEQKLADAQAKIEKINVNKDGSLSTAPLDEQE